MLSVTQLDYNNYWRVFKGNYAKGIRILANILQTPQQANDLTSNLGGVSVLLGTPVGAEDVNSKTLRTMLLESAYADNAVSTWLEGFYTFDDLGTLFADQTVRAEVFASSLLWRAISASSVVMAKYVTNIVGLNPNDYADMQAVAASSTDMTAIAASSTAMRAVVTSTIAMQAVATSYIAEAEIWANSSAVAVVQANSNAWSIFTSASSSVIGKTAAVLVGLNPDDYVDMQAIANSTAAMQAVVNSPTALNAVINSPAAMNAVANSTVAMQAVVNSPTAVNAVINSPAAMNAIANSTTAMQAIANSNTAMQAIATSSKAMQAVASSGTARVAITGSETARNALASSPLKQSVGVTSLNRVYKRVVSGRHCFIISATGKHPYGFGLRYLYTSATDYAAKEYVSQATINMFTTKDGFEAYSNTGSTDIGLTVYYIPC